MDIISEINAKYSALEAEVDRKLDKVKLEEAKLEKLCAKDLENTQKNQIAKVLSYEEALARNSNLLKSIDIAKARLRSHSTFSPMEHILEKAIANYKRDLEHSENITNDDQCDDNNPNEADNLNDYENIYDTVDIVENNG